MHHNNVGGEQITVINSEQSLYSNIVALCLYCICQYLLVSDLREIQVTDIHTDAQSDRYTNQLPYVHAHAHWDIIMLVGRRPSNSVDSIYTVFHNMLMAISFKITCTCLISYPQQGISTYFIYVILFVYRLLIFQSNSSIHLLYVALKGASKKIP